MAEANRLAGKVAIVTGASEGIGEAIAKLFAKEGANVVAVARRAHTLQVAYEAYAQVKTISADVAAADSPERIVHAAVSQFGRLDILVNNAGVNDYQLLEATTDENWQRHLDVNLTAMFKLCRRAATHLRASRAGRIINLASIAAVQVQAGLSAYAATKHAVTGLTKVLAVELGPDGITANYLIPGVILTAMTRPIMESDPAMKAAFESFSVLGRVGMPIDVARAALFLASDEASFITGHGLAVDGGRLAKL
jgi:NAD(P)-dependent dehydrogenase (short-subunit alcohol dehydrogenase family)